MKNSHLLNQLNLVIAAAKKTRYYQKSAESLPQQIKSLDAFKSIKPTSLREFRSQPLSDTITDPSQIEWIVGRYDGQSPLTIPFVENSAASGIRQDLYTQAMNSAGQFDANTPAIVVATHLRRYLGAELASSLVRMGIIAHLFVDLNIDRFNDILNRLRPSILVVLDDAITENLIPQFVNLCVTVRKTHQFVEHTQVDLFLIDELGLLGHSIDHQHYSLNHMEYYFEYTDQGGLIVTPLYNLLQPKLRIETLDCIEFKDQSYGKIILAPRGD